MKHILKSILKSDFFKSIINNEMLCQMSRQGSDLGPGGLGGSEGGAGSVLRKRALTHSSSGNGDDDW